MTDLEITKLCAEAMEYKEWMAIWKHYNPLHDDAQAMALVKKMSLDIHAPLTNAPRKVWHVNYGPYCVKGDNLNRAICKCVAKMMKVPHAPK